MNEYQLEALIVALERAANHARKANMDLHFVSDIDHLIVVAQHNKEELKKEKENGSTH